YYQRIRLPRQHRPSSGWSIQSAYSIRSPLKTVVDLPGSVTLPCPPVPCSQTPPESPAPSPVAGAYWCLPSLRPCRPPVDKITRLNRFTCVTARTSLGLRLAHVVYLHEPKARFQVERLIPLAWAGIAPAGSARLRLAH